ncbi:hypothetical protein [Streptomyces sp. ID05-47C]|uniref:hypothetical protein n=1 Tax=Streptomyces sp. ID05-47C TaxID=3028665 RepID=UPI0029BD7811|nr:hypothetical protein [Streptomyces sp. ID05-47C]MDX3570619.1 hypothetical protein [Streptomyces sp. ID05-47C]
MCAGGGTQRVLLDERWGARPSSSRPGAASTRTTVLTAADGLQGPTSIALRGNTVHVLSAAYLTAKDPNLLLARLGR